MATCVASSVDIALLGCGNVGASLARLAAGASDHLTPVRITGAFVRDPARPRPLDRGATVTSNARALLDSGPSVVVELLGGVEPARSILLAALDRRIPVVTANKTLLARHGRELREAAAATSTALLYEAAVLAGVPFLGTFARRPHAAAATSLVGIANGTSNYVLSRCADGAADVAGALADARRLGYAEPDARADVSGADAAEKLAVLFQHFAGREVDVDRIETSGIDTIDRMQILPAAELGGRLKPVIYGDWTEGPEAFAGVAFVPAAHALTRVDGVENAILLGARHGRLLFQGPGAGPDATAATVLDDVREIAAGTSGTWARTIAPSTVDAPESEWLVTLSAPRLPAVHDVADLLASFGIFTHRTTVKHTDGGREFRSCLAWRSSRPRLEQALGALRRAAGCEASALRALEVTA